MKGKLLVIALALSPIMAGATLVGSFHAPNGTSTNGLDWLAGIPTRTAFGNENTQGTVEGMLSLLGGHPTGANSHIGIGVNTWSAATQIGHYNRWNLSTTEGGGAAVYDFDLSGITSGAWEMKVDYTQRRADCNESAFYISFTGLGRTLDTTAVTNLSLGTGGTLVSDPTKYVKIGSLPANTTSGIYVWDLTGIIEAAQSNGGLVRVVYTDHSYKDYTMWNNDTGLIATDTTTGIPVEVQPLSTLLADDFSSGTSSNSSGVLANNWTGLGPEPKEYNLASSGLLDIRDHDGDEKTNGTYHSGFFDDVQMAFNGVSLTNIGDWIQLSMNVGLYVDDSGAPMHNGVSQFRVTLTQEGASSEAGYGLGLAHGTETVSQFLEFDNAYTIVSGALGTFDYDYPDDGSLVPLRMKLIRVADGLVLSSSWNGIPMVNATNSFAENNVFNFLNVTLTTMDVGCRIDNVKIVSNVPATDAYTLWAIAEGLQVGVNSDPSADPDGDGLDNLAEYGLGGAPTNGADQGISPLSFTTSEGGTNWLVYVYPQRASPNAGISYHIETDTDLTLPPDWVDGNYEVVGVGFPGGDFLYVTNRVETDTEAKQFIRLIIEKNP